MFPDEKKINNEKVKEFFEEIKLKVLKGDKKKEEL